MTLLGSDMAAVDTHLIWFSSLFESIFSQLVGLLGHFSVLFRLVFQGFDLLLQIFWLRTQQLCFDVVQLVGDLIHDREKQTKYIWQCPIHILSFFFYITSSYILHCVFDHVNTTTGRVQVIVCLVLSFLRFVEVLVDLSHVNIFGPVSAKKQMLKNRSLEDNGNEKLFISLVYWQWDNIKTSRYILQFLRFLQKLLSVFGVFH